MDSSDESESDACGNATNRERKKKKFVAEDEFVLMTKEMEKMDLLVLHLTALQDRMKPQCGIWCHPFQSSNHCLQKLQQVNQHLVESCITMRSGFLNPGPMDQLPLDIIVHVMHFTPIQQVFVCMSVNKIWEQAARHAVRSHKNLWLQSKPGLETRKQIPISCLEMDTIVVRKRMNFERLAKSLLLMENLKQLVATDCGRLTSENINPVIVKNAASLQVLYTNFNLPSDGKPVVYQRLRKLRCRFLSQWTECPVLDLAICSYCEPEALIHLPIQTMRRFVSRRILDDEPDDESDDETRLNVFPNDSYLQPNPQTVVQAAKRLIHLTHLVLSFADNDVHCDDILTLLDDFTSLFYLELDLFINNFNFDQKVDQLVRQNPRLHHLRLNCLTISDTALTSIVRLPDLRHLELHGNNTRLTADGVLTLLRSRLRPLLRLAGFTVAMNNNKRKKILHEIDLIAEERGKPLIRKEDAQFSFEFEMQD